MLIQRMFSLSAFQERCPMSCLRLSTFLVCLIALLAATSQSAHADIIDETEPNNTVATANQLVGFNNLGLNGTLTLGDIDEFTFFVQPNADGLATFGYDTTWSATDNSGASEKWLNIATIPPSNTSVTTVATRSGMGGSVILSDRNQVSGFYRMSIFSTTPDLFKPTLPFAPVPSQVAGTYTIRNLRGLNGSTVIGTAAAPEPSALTFVLFTLSLVGMVSVRLRVRRKTV